MKETSFMSEHTAEYALVPDLIDKFSGRFPNITPVYFWGTREGSRVGHESVSGRVSRVVAVFARRPKVLHPGDKSILVKINDILFAAARAGEEVGIPVLAGVPLVNNLVDFSLEVPCSWFQITATSHRHEDYEFRLTLSGQPQRSALPKGVVGPLTKMELIDIAESSCHELDGMLALDGMRHVKSAGRFQHPIFGGGYRPFFLLITTDHGEAPIG